MPWNLPLLRDRRRQVRDDIAAHLPGADASVPNSVLRVVGDAQAALTHDNDRHLEWVARMMMPDTAEGEFAERWANIWLPEGRKPATYARGHATITGTPGAAIPAGTVLTASLVDADGTSVTWQYEVTTGLTLSGASAAVAIAATDAGALGNLDEGATLEFLSVLPGLDASAVVAAPGLAGGADIETDEDLRVRTIDRIQAPPHGGTAHDYVQWALEVPGVTRAWAAQEMGVGTVTIRIMLDDVRSYLNGFPAIDDLDLVTAYIAERRPVTVADFWVVAPVAQPVNLVIDDLIGDTPETRANIAIEFAAMLRFRSRPGAIIYASWIREAVAIATGEDHHDLTIGNVIPASAGHLIVPGNITFT